jgi:dTMP kinase
MKRGFLIVLEGIDGSGKTTQARSLRRRLASRGFSTVFFREPSKGKWGREIRKKAKFSDSLTPEEELDLFIKDRRENVTVNLRPALAAGKVIILDRYYFSTIAYQGAKGIDKNRIRRMNERFAIPPDLVFIMDIEAGKGLSRIENRKRKDELFEREDYLSRVRGNFRSFRGRSIVHLDASRDRKALSDDILARTLAIVAGAGIEPPLRRRSPRSPGGF